MDKNKNEILRSLRDVYDRWEEQLASLDDAQLNNQQFSGGWTIKDDLAHLWAWQQRSIARVEAAQQNREPVFPNWPADLNPNSEEGVDQVNAWIYETNRDRPWDSVYQDWRGGFLRFLAISETIPEPDLMTVGRYPWWKEHALAYVLTASRDHHQEHIEKVQAWLRSANGTA